MLMAAGDAERAELGVGVAMQDLLARFSTDGAKWRASPAGMFRERFCQAFGKAVRRREMVIPESSPNLECLLVTLQSKDWNVYVTPAHGGAQSVLDNLGRYVQKTVISNSRILRVADGEVAFRYHDNGYVKTRCQNWRSNSIAARRS
jgi:hypothetical protein